jgi:hypothetical protein
MHDIMAIDPCLKFESLFIITTAFFSNVDPGGLKRGVIYRMRRHVNHAEFVSKP